jgi:DNA-binding MarR family transcriptional regulator
MTLLLHMSVQHHTNPMIGLVDSVTLVHGRLKSAFAESRLPRERGGLSQAAQLSEMEMVVLNAVMEAERPPTVPQIGRSLGHARQVIQRSANSLVAAGLVSMAANPDHKRAALLLATPKGIKIKRAADKRGVAIADQLLSSVDPKLVAKATALLDQIKLQLESHERSKQMRLKSHHSKLQCPKPNRTIQSRINEKSRSV